MNIEEKRFKIIQIFKQHIIPDVLGDLDILDKIQPSADQNSCAVPTAMLIFSTLDFIGFMLRNENNEGRRIKRSQSTGNIQAAIKNKNYFSRPEYKDLAELVATYRHGMMHAFYPQEKDSKIYGICKSKSGQLFEVSTESGREVISLNVNVLSADFRKFVELLYEKVKTTTDGRLIEDMWNSYTEFYDWVDYRSSTLTTQTTIAPAARKEVKK